MASLTKQIEENLRKAKASGERQRFTDEGCENLRIIAYPDGRVTFAAAYRLPRMSTRPMFTLGDLSQMTLQEARDLTEIVVELGRRGIDLHEGLHTRVVEELKRDGLNWRYALSPPPTKKGR